MKNLFFLIGVVICCNFLQAQNKPVKLTPPKITRTEINMAETKKCFVNITKEQENDSMLLETKSILEYDESYNNNARIVISSKKYDPVKDQQAKKEGNYIVWLETLQYIDGSYKIEKGIFKFTPKKLDNYGIRTFKLVYKPKTKKLDYLKDNENNKYVVGDCPEPIVSVGL